ncbi:MAG TPA: glycosyl hydrolase, partial [Tepidisphaeraceae bacterium]
KIVGVILDAGYGLDFFDDGMLDARGRIEDGQLIFAEAARYRTIILAGVERIPLSTMRKLADFAKHNGLLIATRRLPSRVPGYKATDDDQRALQAIVESIFTGPHALGLFVQDESQLAQALAEKRSRPDVKFSPASPEIGFLRRHTDGGEIYFLANTSNLPKSVIADFRQESVCAQQLDAMTGKISQIPVLGHPEGYIRVALDLPPYGSTILLFSNQVPTSATPKSVSNSAVDFSTGWTVQFGSNEKLISLKSLHSWTDDPSTKYFSGIASYTNHFLIPPEFVGSNAHLILDFGNPTPSASPNKDARSFAADLDAPVRDAAVVYINDKRAGSVWCAPYQLDITNALSPGDNAIRIDVANTAVNDLAGRGFPNYDYSALLQNFGERFVPQRAIEFQPVPSGLLGPITLITSPK